MQAHPAAAQATVEQETPNEAKEPEEASPQQPKPTLARTNTWHAFHDDSTGHKYYFNPDTRQSSWTVPEQAIIVPGEERQSATTNSQPATRRLQRPKSAGTIRSRSRSSGGDAGLTEKQRKAQAFWAKHKRLQSFAEAEAKQRAADRERGTAGGNDPSTPPAASSGSGDAAAVRALASDTPPPSESESTVNVEPSSPPAPAVTTIAFTSPFQRPAALTTQLPYSSMVDEPPQQPPHPQQQPQQSAPQLELPHAPAPWPRSSRDPRAVPGLSQEQHEDDAVQLIVATEVRLTHTNELAYAHSSRCTIRMKFARQCR